MLCAHKVYSRAVTSRKPFFPKWFSKLLQYLLWSMKKYFSVLHFTSNSSWSVLWGHQQINLIQSSGAALLLGSTVVTTIFLQEQLWYFLADYRLKVPCRASLLPATEHTVPPRHETASPSLLYPALIDHTMQATSQRSSSSITTSRTRSSAGLWADWSVGSAAKSACGRQSQVEFSLTIKQTKIEITKTNQCAS